MYIHTYMYIYVYILDSQGKQKKAGKERQVGRRLKLPMFEWVLQVT